MGEGGGGDSPQPSVVFLQKRFPPFGLNTEGIQYLVFNGVSSSRGRGGRVVTLAKLLGSRSMMRRVLSTSPLSAPPVNTGGELETDGIDKNLILVLS